MLDEDPKDYFARIGLENSLFKVIHNRYVAVALRWVSADLSEMKSKH
jgi:hypothetical protein